MKSKYLDVMSTNLHDQIQTLITDIQRFSNTSTEAHTVEQYIHQSLRDIGFNTLELFFKLCGNGDEGSKIDLSDGHTVRRLDKPHKRLYQSIYGEHDIERFVYGTREGQKIECVPLDARINLPESKFSYLLQNWDQSLATDSPYAKVNETIEKILGFKQSVNSLERINNKMSASVNGFWKNDLPTPPQEKESDIFVCSVDGKGVPIRNNNQTLNSNDKAINQSPFDVSDKKQKTGGKKVALVGASYTIAPHIRTPDEIVEALFRDKDKAEKSPRPTPMYKHIRASLLRDEAGTSEPSYNEIFNWIVDEEKTRNPDSKKDIVCVMDGQESLWNKIEKVLPDKNVVEILDLLHACGYVWEAAHIFYKNKSENAAVFAKKRILRMLEGDIAGVIRGLEWKGTYEKLSETKQEDLNKICGYLKNNMHRMKYDEYLAAGYPIASGVIEGACRYAVKDRMERTGMRWILQGAHSMLSLRCIHLSGYWENFMDHRIKEQCEQLYPWRSRVCANDVDYDVLKKVA